MVEGCTETSWSSCSHLLGCLPALPTSRVPTVWPVPPSLLKFPMALTASSNSLCGYPTQAEATWPCWCFSLECQGPDLVWHERVLFS